MNAYRCPTVCSALVTIALLIGVNAAPAAAGSATIIVINANDPDVGFNDPTPATPIGGNTGTTIGQQRLIAFQHAADLWGQTLDSTVPIYVIARFDPKLPANILGGAGPTFVFRDFGSIDGRHPGAEFDKTWYASALADKRAGVDLLSLSLPGITPDIGAVFSGTANFYLGLDTNHGNRPNLVTVVLHELAHGLNFLTLVDGATGRNIDATDEPPNDGHTDIYARYLVEATTGLHWNEMKAGDRAASATRFGRLVWDGANVTANLPSVLVLGSPEARVTAPAAIAGPYQFGTAAFGPAIGSPSVVGTVVAAEDAADAAGPAVTDGCSPFSNAGAVAGNIALIERGACGFAVKARNATNAGAIAAIIYNNAANAAAGAPGMGDDGINGAFVTIPTISLSRPDALAILAQPAGSVVASIGVDPTVRAGADAAGRARLFAPFPVNAGSSVSHYDAVARRNLLMEPAINRDLTHNLKAPDDLTLELLRDIGWFSDEDLDGVEDAQDLCPQSILTPTVVLGDRDTGVPNRFVTGGCTIADLIASIARAARNHGEFVSEVAHLTKFLIDVGILGNEHRGPIMSAAGQTKF